MRFSAHLTKLLTSDILHLGHSESLHRISQLAHNRHVLADLVADRGDGADGRLRRHLRGVSPLRDRPSREDEGQDG